MAVINGKWFREENDQWAGYSASLEIEEILYKERSEYQEIFVFKSKSFGNVLVLDGVIQITERDEFAYQEMIANLPLNCHPNPQKVLIVGGGDGGVVREVLKHPSIQKVVLCEIDEKVVEVSKKYLPHLAQSFDNPRMELFIGDGIQYMKDHKNEFDVIITDAPDPIGPAVGLYEEDYYNNMKNALNPDFGIICCQAENLYLDLPFIEKLMEVSRKIFPKADYGLTLVPTYTGGHIGFILCSSNPDTCFREPLMTYTDAEIKERNLKYYNTDVHRACFTLPQFAKEKLFPDGESQQQSTVK
ncbi:spermidine synthase-like isoform X1 [Mytilus californianus]|uniref:spermidine synthase-like isoform X1 n=1 Tax=Mytilus californianus TaxID=6549 RepID=UPI0022470B4D|nr:spermidine synthase-like isoform X1 [Mytilus californianus]